MNDKELQSELAKFLPSQLERRTIVKLQPDTRVFWRDFDRCGHEVQETEWLHICWLVEKTLTNQQHDAYKTAIADMFPVNCDWRDIFNPSWQQRAEALLKVLTK